MVETERKFLYKHVVILPYYYKQLSDPLSQQLVLALQCTGTIEGICIAGDWKKEQKLNTGIHYIHVHSSKT